MQYILRRLGFYAVAAWVSLTLNFFLPRAMPGDPASRLMGSLANEMTPEEIDALRHVYGLSDAPIWEQYFAYLSHLARGDLGLSFSSFPTPVSTVISTSIYWSLLLGVTTLTIGFIAGNLLGVVAAWRRGGFVDTIFPPFLMLMGSFPYFWLAMSALYFLGFKLGWFPMRHAYGIGVTPSFSMEFVQSMTLHLILPATTIIVVSVGGWMLGMRNTMVAVLAEDYVTMAEAKGLSEHRVMTRYAARNALLPAITSFGLAFGFIFSGSLLTEIVFAYPGLGFQLLTAVRGLDYPLMQGILLMITFAVLGANFIVDLIYVRFDPRVRLS